MMDNAARDVMDRAARLARLERAAAVIAREQPARRMDIRPLLAAALALLLSLYPGMSAAATLLTTI